MGTKMKLETTFCATVLFIIQAATTTAFFSSSSSSFLTESPWTSSGVESSSKLFEYIPSGLSKERWNKMKEEKNKNKNKNLGAVGITSFKSRTFSDWQKSGGKNLFPVDPKKVKDQSEIPYMQRTGGSVDGSDLKNAKKKTGTFFTFGGKKKSSNVQPASKQQEQPKKKNWWELK